MGATLPFTRFNASLNELVKSSSWGKEKRNSWRKLQKFKVFFFLNPLKGSLPLIISSQHFQQKPWKKKKRRKDSQLLLYTVITTSLSRFPLGAPGDPLSRCERPDPTCLHRPGLHRAARNVGSRTDVYTCLFNSQRKPRNGSRFPSRSRLSPTSTSSRQTFCTESGGPPAERMRAADPISAFAGSHKGGDSSGPSRLFVPFFFAPLGL